MKILLTGAFGNLGSHTLAALVQRGYRVRALARPSRSNRRAAACYAGQIETIWGDIRSPQVVHQAVSGVDVVLHLAAIIPPYSDEYPQLAYQVNVEGTKHIVAACQAQPQPPRLFFASSVALFGYTQHLPPPRKCTDPVQPTDPYTHHKAKAEAVVRASGLPWLIFRFSDMPPIALREPHPVMYEISLDSRFETMHPADGALALVNALAISEIWTGRLLLIGGGSRCQLTYRQYLFGLLEAMGIGALPEEAFATRSYYTDWLDTSESQRLLRYQRHTFTDIKREIAAQLGWKRYLIPLVRPLARRQVLSLSPYYKGQKA